MASHSTPPNRGVGVLVVITAILLTLVSVPLVFVSPRPPHLSLTTQAAVFESGSAIEDPVLSADGMHVAFSYNASGNFEIWQSTLQGTKLTRLTYMQGDSRFPGYSPDGMYIAFYHAQGASGEFVLIKSDGAGMKVLSDGPVADEFSAWNPDGSLIAFDELAGGKSQVIVLDIRSNSIVLRTDGSSPAWSQDGRLLTFVRVGEETSALYISDLGGNTTRLLTSEGLLLYPKFFRNSTSIVCLSRVNNSWTVQAVRLKDGLVSNLLEAPVGGILRQTWTPGVYFDSLPIVKPDGSSVIFSGHTNQSLMDLFEVIPDTIVKVHAGGVAVEYPATIVNRLTSVSYDSVGVPSWSSSGKLITFSAKDSAGRYELVLLSYGLPQSKSQYG